MALRLVSTILAFILVPGCGSFERLVDVQEQAFLTSSEAYDTSLYQRRVHTFDPVDLSEKVERELLERRVEDVWILLDLSSENNGNYHETPAIIYSLEIARRLLRTLPYSFVDGEFYIHGLQRTAFSDQSANFIREDVLNQLEVIGPDTSFTTAPLSTSVQYLGDKANQSKGPSALVLITNFDNIDDSVLDTVDRLFQQSRFSAGVSYGDASASLWQNNSAETEHLCLHVIGSGNLLSRSKLLHHQRCGMSVSAEKLMSAGDMAYFVEQVMYSGPADTDGDGIFDYVDECQGSQVGRVIGFDGCYRF